MLSDTAILPAARNRTRLLDIPGRLSRCLRRAVRFWLTDICRPKGALTRMRAAGNNKPDPQRSEAFGGFFRINLVVGRSTFEAASRAKHKRRWTGCAKSPTPG